MSCVGLTSGAGAEGAFITSRMYWGGWLYPDAPFAGAEVMLDADDFDCAAFDCAAADKQVVQANERCGKYKVQDSP